MAKLELLGQDGIDATADAVAAPQHSRTSLVFVADELVRSVVIRDGQSLTVGRNPPADVVLSEPTVSRRHARFSLEQGVLCVEDTGSHNGVFVNGRAVREAELSDTDRVRIGAIEVFALDASRAPERDARELSALRFVSRLSEELERTRYAKRPLWLCALRWPTRTPGPEQVARATEALWPVDRFCRHAPHIVLTALIERNQTTAQATLNAMQRRVDLAQTALVSAPPFELNAEELIAKVIDLVHRQGADENSHVDTHQPALGADDAIVRGTATRRLFDLAERTGHADLPLLVLGETGAGKEVIARQFHEYSQRARGPFCEVNCAAIAPTLVESILFGHEKGAFTGADKRAPGLFEQAQGGTLFLDELGELSQGVQGALLRVLECKRIRRVGGSQELTVDVRIIAATNRELRELVARGQFREDLLYRLEALTVLVPPLRERKDEIEPLASLFMNNAAARWRAPARALAEPVRRALLAYAWPGNIRQLRNVIERAVAVCPGEFVQLEHLPEHVSDPLSCVSGSVSSMQAVSLPDAVSQFEVDLIRNALARSGGNHARAARLLGIPRRTLGGKLRAHDLDEYEPSGCGIAPPNGARVGDRVRRE